MQLPGRGNGSPRLTALLLVGHGSDRHADAGAVLLAHADALAPHVDRVAVGLLNGTPSVSQALERLGGGPIDVVPLFMEAGYFTRVAVPQALGGADPARFRLHPPLGAHPAIPGLIAARAPADEALLLVGHGSARAPGRRQAAHAHAEALRATGRHPVVEIAFLEEPPDIARALARIGDRPVSVMGLFMQYGTHARDDLPALLTATRRWHPPRALGIIGEDPGLRPLILSITGAG